MGAELRTRRLRPSLLEGTEQEIVVTTKREELYWATAKRERERDSYERHFNHRCKGEDEEVRSSLFEGTKQEMVATAWVS